MRGIRSVGVFQRVEAVAGRRQGGASPLQGLELQQRARPGGGGGPGGPRRRRKLVVGRLVMMMVVGAVIVATAPLFRYYRIALAPAAVNPFVFQEISVQPTR